MESPRTNDAAHTIGVAPHKLIAPSPVAPGVGRRRITDLLDEVTARTTLLIAPAGSGKSTMLSLWAHGIDPEFAWFDVDSGDNDAVRLIRGIAAGLSNIADRDELVAVARDVRPATVTKALAALELALAGVPPFVLIIDDAHLITAPAAGAVLDGLIDAMPRGSRLIISGRNEPSIHVARRRVNNELVAIDVGDLLLTLDESLSVLEAIAPTTDVDTRAELAAQIDGWAAGLQFAALAFRVSEAADIAMPADLTHRDLIANYFQQEFLASLTLDERTFLTSTSVLEQLSDDLCNHVLDRTGSADHLRTLISAGNAFVVPIGNGQFRYHDLFREFLVGELRSSTPELEAQLRTRAIEWYEQHGQWAAAVRTALESGRLIASSPLILKYLVPRLSAGETASIGEWLDHFTHADISTDPLLAIAAAWFAMFSNRPSEMTRWLEIAESLDFDGPLPDGTCDISTAAAAVRMLAGTGGVGATARYARQIREAAPHGGPWSSVACLLEAVALSFAGAIPNRREMFEDAEFETRSFPPAHATALAHLALDSLQRRDLESAQRELREALDEVRHNGLTDFNQVSLVFCAKALLDAETGAHSDSAAAAAHACDLLVAIDNLHVRSQIHHHLVLAEAAILRSDWAEAVRLTALAGPRLPNEPEAIRLHEWWEKLHRRCTMRNGLAPLVELTAAERRVLEQLATHRTLAEVGDHLYVSRNTVKTHTVSIYRKLVVSGRSEAVERAMELGLLNIGQLPFDHAAASAS